MKLELTFNYFKLFSKQNELVIYINWLHSFLMMDPSRSFYRVWSLTNIWHPELCLDPCSQRTWLMTNKEKDTTEMDSPALGCWGCQNKAPQTGQLQWYIFTVSRFWKLEIQKWRCWQGWPFWGLWGRDLFQASPWLVEGCLLPVSLHTIFPQCIFVSVSKILSATLPGTSLAFIFLATFCSWWCMYFLRQ